MGANKDFNIGISQKQSINSVLDGVAHKMREYSSLSKTSWKPCICCIFSSKHPSTLQWKLLRHFPDFSFVDLLPDEIIMIDNRNFIEERDNKIFKQDFSFIYIYNTGTNTMSIQVTCTCTLAM